MSALDLSEVDPNELARDPRIVLSLSHLITAASLAACIFVTGNTAIDALSLTTVKRGDQTIQVGVMFWRNCSSSEQFCWSQDEQTIRLYLSITHGLGLATAIFCLWAALICQDALTLSRTYAANVTLLSLASISQVSALFFLFLKVGYSRVSPAIALSLAPSVVALTTAAGLAFLWISGKRFKKNGMQRLTSKAEMGMRHNLENDLFGLGWDNAEVVKRAGIIPSLGQVTPPEKTVGKDPLNRSSDDSRKRSATKLVGSTDRINIAQDKTPTRPSPRPMQPANNQAAPRIKQAVRSLPDQPLRPAEAAYKANGPPVVIPESRPRASPIAYRAPPPSTRWTHAYNAVHHLTSGPSKTTQELASEDLLEDLLVKAREEPPSALRIGRPLAKVAGPTYTENNQHKRESPQKSRALEASPKPTRSSPDIPPIISMQSSPALAPLLAEQTNSSTAGTESLVDKMVFPSSVPVIKAPVARKESTSRPSTVPDLDKLVLPFSEVVEPLKIQTATIKSNASKKPAPKPKKADTKPAKPFKKPLPFASRHDALSSESDVFEISPMKRPIEAVRPGDSLNRFIADAITEFSDPPAIVISKPAEESPPPLKKSKSKRLQLPVTKSSSRAKALLSPRKDSFLLPKAKLLKQKTTTKVKDGKKKKPKSSKEETKRSLFAKKKRPVSESTEQMVDNWKNLPFTPVPLSAAEADTGRESFSVPIEDAGPAAEARGTASISSRSRSEDEATAKADQSGKEDRLRKRSEKSKTVSSPFHISSYDLSKDRSGNNST